MSFTISQALLTPLLIACFGSFTWAVRKFFVRPEKLTLGLRLTLLAGTIFACLHLFIIWSTPPAATAMVITAALLYVFSLGMFWWAIAANKRKPLSACFAQGEALHLVQHGPYRLVRHPFYCAYLLAWVAGAVGTWNPLLAMTAVVMFVLYLTAAVNEENKFAASSLARDYEVYRQSTGRFFPNPFKSVASRHSH